MEYIAFIHKEDNSYVGVVPDLGYVSSYGDTFEEAVHMTMEACELYCEDLKTLPKPSTLDYLLDNADIKKGSIPQLLNIKVEKLKRINIMMRSDIIDTLPTRLVEFNGNRSAYLQNLVLEDLRSHNIQVN